MDGTRCGDLLTERSTTLLRGLLSREGKWKTANGRHRNNCLWQIFIGLCANKSKRIQWRENVGRDAVEGDDMWTSVREKENGHVALQGSITGNCKIRYLLHRVQCGFIALGRCLDEGGDY